MQSKKTYASGECREFIILTACLACSDLNFLRDTHEFGGKVTRMTYNVLKGDLENYIKGVPENARIGKYNDVSDIVKKLAEAQILER